MFQAECRLWIYIEITVMKSISAIFPKWLLYYFLFSQRIATFIQDYRKITILNNILLHQIYKDLLQYHQPTKNVTLYSQLNSKYIFIQRRNNTRIVYLISLTFIRGFKANIKHFSPVTGEMVGKTAQHDVYPQETCNTLKTGYIS